MIRQLFMLAGLLISIPTFSQYTTLGADAFARANTLVAVSSFSSVYSNPSGLGFLNYSFLSASYFKTLPIQGFHTVGFSGHFANRVLNIGISADSFGDKYYKESRLGLALAKKLDKVSIGAKLSYLGVHIEQMSNRNTLLGEIGMLVKPAKFFSFGLHFVNFTNAKLYGETGLPIIIILGAAVNPNEKVTISCQSDYELRTRPVVRLGINYQIRKQIGVSAGVNPELRVVHFGLNFSIEKFTLFYGASTHPNVGIANQFTLMRKFNE